MKLKSGIHCENNKGTEDERNMKTILKSFMHLIIICFIIAFTIYCFIFINNVVPLVSGSYPALGDYYIFFDQNEDNSIFATVYYQQEIYSEPVDLNNLYLYADATRHYSLKKEDIYSDSQIRKMLLERGLAKIVDESIASKEEISYQTKAIKNEVGIWDNTKNNQSYISLHYIYYKINCFLISNLGVILKWIVFTGISISTIYFAIRKWISRRRIDTIFMGGVSSGKTTVLKRIEKPSITEGKLLAETTTTKTGQIVKCDRIAYKNKDIYPYLFDNQGDSYGEMIDAINKFGIKKSDKKVIVYVITFTKENSQSFFDYELVNSQISKAAVLVKSFKTSRSLKKVKKIIIFFNKCDLLYDSESEFLKNKYNIENKYKKSIDYQELYDYADAFIFGSALIGWGIDEVKDEILSIN